MKARGARLRAFGRRGAAGGRWPGVWRTLTALFAIVVVALLLNHARSIDFMAVFAALRAMPLPALLAAAGLAIASHAVYASYDLVGRRHTGHPLTVPQVLGVTFVSYAFNLNLGALVGGIALRYRLYARLGLAARTTSEVLVLSLAGNWLGYAAVAGVLLLWRPLELPAAWPLHDGVGLRLLGVGLCLVVVAYLALCLLARGGTPQTWRPWGRTWRRTWRHTWRVRGQELRLPSGPLALAQVGLAAANWLLIGAVAYLLLQRQVDYPTVLGVLLLGAVAGVVTHVPAGLGVLEAVFVMLLSHRIDQAELLAALLAYRAVYYLAPLAAAAGLLVWLETRPRRRGAPATPSAPSPPTAPSG